jgi:small GTP-binding protein
LSMPKAGYAFKVIFIGDPAVGKTAIVHRHVTSSFKENYIPSLGTNVSAKDYDIEGRYVTLMIWDIAAQERFNDIRGKYYKGTRAAAVVYDVTRPVTLDNAIFWFEDVKRFVQEKIQMALIANKIDLSTKVDTEAGQKLAGKIGAIFFETSAKTGENVDRLFQNIAKILLGAALSSSP